MINHRSARRLTSWFAGRPQLESLEDRSVPAAITYVDDDWAGLATGADPDGAGPATAIGTDAFATIQDGVTNADAGGTVNVAAGTYPENVTVNKALTVLGAQANVVPTGRTLGGAAESTVNPAAGTQVFQVTAGGVVINGFSITTTGTTVQGVSETTPVSGTEVSYNLISGFTSSIGVSIAAGSTGSVIRFNDISNNYAGVYLATGATGATISQNDIHGNVGVAPVTGDEGSGIVLEGNNTNVTITQNFLRDNATAGVYVFDIYGTDFTGTQVVGNSITGNASGVENTNATVLDAPGNWWGTSDGAGVAAAAGANVDFTPSLPSGIDTSTAFGFQAGTIVTGVVFNDANESGVRDAGEAGVDGLTVFLDLNNNGVLDPTEPSTVSATVGGQAGTYTLFATQFGGTAAARVVEQPGFVTNTTSTAVALDGTPKTVDVGAAADIPPQVLPSRQFAVAGTVAGATTVRVYNPTGTLAYEVAGGTGDLRVAVGDVTGDGVEDVVIGSGIGTASLVRVIDGATRQEVARFSPFEAAFTGGVYVTLGDLTGDGLRDIVVTPDQGGGPRVVVYAGGAVGSTGAFTQVASFFGIDDPAFRGGARAAVGDVNADGRADLAVAAGFLGGPRVAVYDGTTVVGGTPTRLVNDFFAFESTLRNGAYVAVGDLNGDGFGDLIFGAGPGGAPRVLAVSGQILLSQGSAAALAAPLANFFGGDSTNRSGIRVAAKDLDGDGRADFLTGGGSGTAVVAYDGQDLTQLFTLSSGSDAAGAFNGVFLG